MPNGRNITPVEIKSSSTFNKAFSVNLIRMMKFAHNAEKPAVVYSGTLECRTEDVRYINFKKSGTLVYE